MNPPPKCSVPVWYWLIAGASLLWNLLGCASFATEMFAQEAALESYTEAQKAWVRSIPSWIYAVYGVAVLTGVAGSVGLLMRQGWALPMFAISLPAILVQMIYTMLLAGGLQAMGPTSLILPALIIASAAALLCFSWYARSHKWLGPATE
jgi:hypothetical protein